MGLLEQEGVKFICNVEIGKDVPGHLMVAENDAVLICTGATKPRDLPIPGIFRGFKKMLKFFNFFLFRKGFERDPLCDGISGNLAEETKRGSDRT